MLFHYAAASALPGRDPRCQSGPGVRWKMEGEAGRGKVDLLVTITIELLYKAPVDNIGGITKQERQFSFIKKRPCWCWRETKATSMQGWPL